MIKSAAHPHTDEAGRILMLCWQANPETPCRFRMAECFVISQIFLILMYSLDFFPVVVISCVGVIEAAGDLAADAVGERVGVDLEAGGEGVGFARLKVQLEILDNLVAAGHLAVALVCGIHAAQDFNLDIVERAGAVVGDAGVDLAVGLVAGIDVRDRYIGFPISALTVVAAAADG